MEGSQVVTIFIVGVLLIGVLVYMGKSIYKKTGVNSFKLINKLLWYVEACIVFYGMGAGWHPAPLVLIVLAFGVLHTVMYLKAGTANAIILGVLHAVGGAFAAAAQIAFWVADLAMKLAFGTGTGGINLSGVFNINEATAASQAAYAAQQAQQKAEDSERADAYAHHDGFQNADEAEDWGISTGKPQD